MEKNVNVSNEKALWKLKYEKFPGLDCFNYSLESFNLCLQKLNFALLLLKAFLHNSTPPWAKLICTLFSY